MKKFKYIAFIALFITLLGTAPRAEAVSLNLDDIAKWGKFPRFCVNVYNWGADFFNGYDTTYVAGTGYNFNTKFATDSWMDQYDFVLPNNKVIIMNSQPTISAGVHLSYLAVSIGYDINVRKIFTGREAARSRWRFGFNCMLFSIEAYTISNDEGTTIKRFGAADDSPRLNIDFDGVYNSTSGLNAVYFFNHKRYSEAAAFNFSRVQRQSAGSFFAGFSYYDQSINFDFRKLPPHMRNQLPPYWTNFEYKIDTKNYGIRLGYGHNWVLPRGWVFGISESPIVGIRVGHVSGMEKRKSFALYNRLKLSFVWNHNQWFTGVLGKGDLALVSDRRTTFIADIYSVEAVLGYRFNLW